MLVVDSGNVLTGTGVSPIFGRVWFRKTDEQTNKQTNKQQTGWLVTVDSEQLSAGGGGHDGCGYRATVSDNEW